MAYIKITWAWHKYIKYLIEMQIFRSQLMSSCYKIHELYELYESVWITSPNLIGQISFDPKNKMSIENPKEDTDKKIITWPQQLTAFIRKY